MRPLRNKEAALHAATKDDEYLRLFSTITVRVSVCSVITT